MIVFLGILAAGVIGFVMARRHYLDEIAFWKGQASEFQQQRDEWRKLLVEHIEATNPVLHVALKRGLAMRGIDWMRK